MPPVLDELNRKDRLRLVKFVCSFAWADLEIRSEERAFVAKMVRRLELDDEDTDRVEGWLSQPPEPDSVDPTLIPAKHRELFIEAVEGVIESDGEIAPEERDQLSIFQDLLS